MTPPAVTSGLLNTALQIHGWGANVTAIVRGTKKTAHKWQRWQTTRQTRQDVNRLAMWDTPSIAGLGIMSGVNGWRVIDIDICTDPAAVVYFLKHLNLPPDYHWAYRSGSHNGWGIVIRCPDDLPPGRLTPQGKNEPGVFWFYPKLLPFFEFHHIELRWANCQNVIPPSAHPKGPGYQWLHGPPDSEPATVDLFALLGALELIGTQTKIEPEAAPPVPEPPKKAEHSPKYLNGTVDSIKQKLDILTTAQRLFTGEIKSEPNGEKRILGHGGLLLNKDEQVFYNFRGEAGGDVLDLYGLSEFDSRWDRNNPQMFKAVLQRAADDAGVDLSQANKKSTDSAEPEPPPAELFPHFTLSQGLKLPETDYLVYGAIGEGDIGMIYGDAAAGKTYLAIDLAVSMAAGVPWMGRWGITQPRKVLYFISEGRRRFFRRILAAVNGMGPRGFDVSKIYRLVDKNLAIVTEVPQLFNPDAARHAKRYVAYWQDIGAPKVDFVFIDTLHRASIGAEENSSKDAGVVVDAVTWLQRQMNCAACFVHHANKSGGYRGSTAYRGNVDFVLKVEGIHREPRKLTIDKMRDGEHDGPVEGVNYVSVFRVDEASTGTYATWLDDTDFAGNSGGRKDLALAEIRQLLNERGEMSINKLAGLVKNVSKNTAKGYIRELIETGEITTAGGERKAIICSLTQFG